MSRAPTATDEGGRPWVSWLFAFGCAGTAALLVARGYDFYRLDVEARIDHPDFRILGPGELWGHGYGILGTGLIVLNLLYVVRRALVGWPLGSMRTWLDLHVGTGFLGGLLVLFHSAFQLRTIIAGVTSASLLAVIVTGAIGRWLHALAPATSTDALDAALDGLDLAAPKLGATAREALGRLPLVASGDLSLFGALVRLPAWLWRARQRRRLVWILSEDDARGMDRAARRAFAQRVHGAAKAAEAQSRAVAAAAVLRTWRSLHRYLAIVMLLSVSVHIATAWYFGYRWIFGD